jgi:tRNA G18 (ribose-2'-O)-methylase SpoU
VALDGVAEKDLEIFQEETKSIPVVAIFGNEARGLPVDEFSGERIKIEMNHQVESYNLATAAAIVFYRLRK